MVERTYPSLAQPRIISDVSLQRSAAQHSVSWSTFSGWSLLLARSLALCIILFFSSIPTPPILTYTCSFVSCLDQNQVPVVPSNLPCPCRVHADAAFKSWRDGLRHTVTCPSTIAIAFWYLMVRSSHHTAKSKLRIHVLAASPGQARHPLRASDYRSAKVMRYPLRSSNVSHQSWHAEGLVRQPRSCKG